MAGVKRAAVGDPSPWPQKIRRLGSGTASVADAIAMEVHLADAAKTENGSPEPGLLFVNASAEAVAAFDWSGLVGALNDEELLSVRRLEDDDLIVNVPGAVRHVPISRRMILKEIANYLGLKVFNFGMVVESKDITRAWVDMEIPSSRVCSARDRMKFYSDEASGRHEAMKDACDAAILHLRTTCFVLVKDVNYEEVRALQKRALAAETWSTLLNDALNVGEKNNEAIRAAYASFFMEAKRLCMDFGDMFGAGTIGVASTSTAPNDEKMYYGGPRPPITRAEQLAFSLVDLINRSANAAILDADKVSG